MMDRKEGVDDFTRAYVPLNHYYGTANRENVKERLIRDDKQFQVLHTEILFSAKADVTRFGLESFRNGIT